MTCCLHPEDEGSNVFRNAGILSQNYKASQTRRSRLEHYKQFGMRISPLRYRVLAFKGQVPTRSKIIIHNTTFEQVNTFTYLGHKISYEEGKDITSKINFYNFWEF